MILLDNIIYEPKDWCHDLDCVSITKKTIYLPNDRSAYNVLQNQFAENPNDIPVARVLEKSSKLPLTEYEIDQLYDIIKGQGIFIADSFWIEKALTTREFTVDKDDWLITARQNYSLQVGIIRKTHPKEEEIRKKINECLEFGIIDKSTERLTYSFALLIYALLENYFKSDEEAIAHFYSIVNYHKENISVDDYKGIFTLLLFGLNISFDLLLIEILAFMLFKIY